MSRRLTWFLFLTLMLGLALGCGVCELAQQGREVSATVESLAGGEEGPAPTQSPAGDGAATEEVEQEELSLSSVTSGLQSLDSYRGHLVMTFEGTAGEEAEQWAVEMDVEYVRQPFAQRVLIKGDMVEGHFESIQIGDQQYVVFEDQCFSSSAGEGEGAWDMEVFELEDFLGGLDEAKRVRPDEEVNGILCRHYTFDETAVSWASLSRAAGEVWVAVDGGYVVKYTLRAEGENPVSQEEGRIEWEYELRDVNAPITIEPPPDCEAAAIEFPIMPDATDVTTLGGIVMYTSPSSLDDVIAFYQEQMPADGWKDTGDAFISENNAMLSYTKEGRLATVTLTSEDGKISVVVMSE